MNLYPEEMETISMICRKLNETFEEVKDDPNGDKPYVTFVPVYSYHEPIGYITDEIGGAYSFHEASPEWIAWYKTMPRS